MFGREEDGTRLHRVQVRDHRADRVGIGERRRAPHQSRQSGGDVGLRRREDLTGDPRLAGAGRVVNAHHRARGNRRLRRRAPIHTETADTVGDGAHRRRRVAVASEPRQCPLDQRATPPGVVPGDIGLERAGQVVRLRDRSVGQDEQPPWVTL